MFIFEYHELSLHADIYLSICKTGSFLHWFNYSIKFQVNADHIVAYDINNINNNNTTIYKAS